MHEIRVGEDLRDGNRKIAEENRKHLSEHGIVAVNIMSAPGAGKTSLLERAIPILEKKYSLAVIEGDVQTNMDADRIEKLGVQVYQIQTGGACHLDAAMVHSALHFLDLEKVQLLLIENVGNLVCPAEFDLGEDARVMLLSVAEGDDKPKKYPLMFREAKLLVLNKTDLLPHVDFDIDRVRRAALEINPKLEMIELSCKTGEGVERFAHWVDRLVGSIRRI